VDTVEVRMIIDGLRAHYEAAVASGDLAALGSVVTSDVIAVGPGGPHWDSLRAASPYPWPPGATLSIGPMEVRVLSADWAHEMGTSTATYTPPGDSITRTLRDTYLVLFRRTPEGWKLHREVASPDLPPGS
jgi:ketosteroid isomerase-like protein